MANQNDILTELGQISPILGSLPKVENRNDLPAGYFADFSQNMLRIVELVEESKQAEPATPTLYALPKRETKVVPVAYFEHFSTQVVHALRHEEVCAELSALTPVLATLPRAEAPVVPAGYFASFAAAMTRAVTVADRKPAHRLSRIADSLLAWVETYLLPTYRPVYALVSACVIGLIVCSALYFMHSATTTDQLLIAQMQQLPETELNEYVSTHSDEFDETIHSTQAHDLTDKEIENLLTENHID